MTEEELIEQLADKEHASWARWQAYLFSLCVNPADEYGAADTRSLVILAERVERWQRQIATPYADLSEQEKQYDRDEVALILPIINQYVTEREPLSATSPSWVYPKCPQCGQRNNPTVNHTCY